MKFDVSIQPWIPVVMSDGTSDELSLRDALARAHLIRAVVDPMPTVEFGLHRLLVALVLDIFGPRDLEDWADLWDGKVFDAGALDKYFEQNSDCFDLFDVRKPFLQSAGMEGEKSKPLAGLLPPMPSGTATNHFHHGDEEHFGVAPAVAARLLTTIAPWMTAGGAGLSPSVNGAPPFYVLPLGKNLFQTLLLNTPVLKELGRAQGEEIPAWRDPTAVTATRAVGASLLGSFSWRPRRIQLVAGECGACSLSGDPAPALVREMKFAPGFGAGFEWIDPNCAFRIGDERLILRPRENREVWRDTGPLALLREKSWQSKNGKIAFERPAILSQIGALIGAGILPSNHQLALAIYAVRTDLKMKTFEWVHETLRLPFALLQGERAAIEAQNALENAEMVAFVLRRAIKMAYPREGKGNDAANAALAATTEKGFWRELKPHFDDFLEFLARPHEDKERDSARHYWRDQLGRVGWDAITLALDDLDGNARDLERQTAAYKNFRDGILAVVNPEKAEQRAQNANKKKVVVAAAKQKVVASEQLSLI